MRGASGAELGLNEASNTGLLATVANQPRIAMRRILGEQQTYREVMRPLRAGAQTKCHAKNLTP
jgi:hypothetical protein